MINIETANSDEQLSEIRRLFVAYADSISVDLSYQDFAKELDSLPGAYAAPHGRLLLAQANGISQGCCAVRPLATDSTGEVAELKRLYVVPECRGHRLGRRLVDAALAQARLAGYRRVVLDTLADMHEARRLYESLGFIGITAYYDSPIAGTRFMQRTL